MGVASGAGQRVLLLGATGTIGIATARALLRRGHEVVCLVRPRQGVGSTLAETDLSQRLAGATVMWGNATEEVFWKQADLARARFDAVVSCMASRMGSPQDAWRVDHQAHVWALHAAQAAGVKHFVQLSAICVQKPLLAFQHAKLAFEKTLIESGLTYSIVRPTAFFKSLSGQLDRVKKGKPFLMFGDGQLTACKPISDDDLADFLVGCIHDVSRHNQILPIGGPGPAITPLAQGEQLFALLGKPPRFKRVPVGLLDVIVGVLSVLGKLIPAGHTLTWLTNAVRCLCPLGQRGGGTRSRRARRFLSRLGRLLIQPERHPQHHEHAQGQGQVSVAKAGQLAAFKVGHGADAGHRQQRAYGIQNGDQALG
jgi:divinyl chlorophyllide a 8-vinyl-reductase